LKNSYTVRHGNQIEFEPHADLRGMMRQVEGMEITTAFPLILNLLDRFDRGQLSKEDLCGCLHDLVSFVLRRSICGETTRTYGKWFVEAITTIRSNPRADLQNCWLSRRWPDDVAVRGRLPAFELYRRESTKTRVILEALEESFGHRERVDLSTLTIEHVMPQTISNNKHGKAWKEILGDEWETSYAGSEAAHVDVSPRPTTPMLDAETGPVEFRAMVEHDVKWFFQLLDQLPQVQLLLVAGPVPRENGQKQQLADFIREQARRHGAKWSGGQPLPRLATAGHPNGIPVFVCPYEPKVDGLYAMVRQVYRNRAILRRLAAPGMNSIPIMPTRLDWPSTIGNFLLNYGTLDYFVFVFLKDHLSGDEFDRISEWHFNDRVKRIAQHLKDEKYPADQQTAFARLLERLEPIRELRNHLAHGHMYVWLDPETRTPRITLFKAKALDTGLLPDSKHVEFAELLPALAVLAELIEEFQALAGFKTSESDTTKEDSKC
jgi:hypothetical protein